MDASVALNKAEIKRIIGSTPKELANYFHAKEIVKHKQSRINCLSFEEAKKHSEAMNDFPKGKTLGLWVLDDANDSNPYYYISNGPCKGAIIHYSHDLGPKIKFSSLDAFVASLREAANSNTDIDDIRIDDDLRIDTESGIVDLLDRDSDELTNIICLYIDVAMSLSDKLINKILKDDDFFLHESLALWLAKNPNIKYRGIAKTLSEHKMAQVSREAKLALSSMNKLK